MSNQNGRRGEARSRSTALVLYRPRSRAAFESSRSRTNPGCRSRIHFSAGVSKPTLRRLRTSDGITSETARRTLEGLGYERVHIRVGDGHQGWPGHAPYDRILVAAAAETVPPALVGQLADTGVLVIPVGVWHQELRVLRKHGERLELLATLAVRFVPLVKR